MACHAGGRAEDRVCDDPRTGPREIGAEVLINRKARVGQVIDATASD
jgi:hypothetical protein